MGGDTAPVNNHSVHCDFWFTGKPDYAGCESNRRNCNSGISVLYGRHDLLELFFIDGHSTANTFITNSSIMGKVYFPRLVSPAASTISNLISFGIQFAMFLIFLLYFIWKGKMEIRLSGISFYFQY